MAFAFRRLTSANSQEIIDSAASYTTIVDNLSNFDTIQLIKTVDRNDGTIVDSIAYKDPNAGNRVTVLSAKDRIETSISDIETNYAITPGTISGWVSTNFGDVIGPEFDKYQLYQYNDPKSACQFGTKSSMFYRVYVYKSEVFTDPEGQSLFDGGSVWYYVVDASGAPTGESWQINRDGYIIGTFACEF